MNKFLTALSVFITLATPIRAEEINLVADERVEWHQNEQKMVAVGNAVASKKDMSIRADTITAVYDKAQKTSGQVQAKGGIKTVHANGGVIMKSATANGFGDTMDYDVATDTMILKGQPAKIKTEKEDISAQGSITYYPSKQQAIALDNVIATDAQKNKVFSDRMVSFFEKNSQGALEMNRIEIYDNVKIVTKDAEVTADRGIYLPKEALIKLFDKVVISQNGNFIRGDYAVTDLNTGVSRLITKKGSGKRVSGVFKEKDKNTKPSKPTAAPQSESAPKSETAPTKPIAQDKQNEWHLGTPGSATNN